MVIKLSPDKIDITDTPSIPKDLNPVEISDNARKVLTRRYLRRGDDGKPAEKIEQMYWRVAYNIANVEQQWEIDINHRARQFYKLLTEKRFSPNSPTFTGAGTPLGQLAACFVLPVSDDMGKDPTGIFQTLRDAALIQQTGGGNGFSFSRLRPKGTLVNTSAGHATGPVGFLHVYDQAFGEIAQGGTRRGANMAVLRIDHPDIEDFICCKTNEDAITNFNISVGITDAFMDAVSKNQPWDLCFPDVKSPEYSSFDGSIDQAREADIPVRVYKTVQARDLFEKIVHHAHHNGEPGVLFIDTANRSNPLPHLYTLESTNPCGEQWLGPYENCCLGSINLAVHVDDNGEVDWEHLRESVELSTIFLDDVIDANSYIPAVPKLRLAALKARRIGLGIMGLSDLMYQLNVRYGSEESQEFAAQIMEFVRFHAMLTSTKLAQERGPFPEIQGSIYDPQNLTWDIPEPLTPYQKNWNRPTLDWKKISDEIIQHGIRNAAQTTIAPTGTVATVVGCEGYGCEPVFALAYTRYVKDDDSELPLTYVSPLFESALEKEELEKDVHESIINQVVQTGSCINIEQVPENLKNVFVVSSDISAEEHIRMQAAMQAFVDNSLSKTINFPADATKSDVAKAYTLAWELGCKGITVYITGSREKVVLETIATDKWNQIESQISVFSDDDDIPAWLDLKKPRPRSLDGHTFSINTPVGKAFVTINENGDRQPFEVFINTAKAGSETAAVSEAIGRLISYILRLASPLSPRKRLKAVWEQLSGIGGGTPMGFGPNRVRSLPDGVSHLLAEYLENTTLEQPIQLTLDENSDGIIQNGNPDSLDLDYSNPDNLNSKFSRKIGDLCPECGQAALVNEEGCRKCYACSYSDC